MILNLLFFNYFVSYVPHFTISTLVSVANESIDTFGLYTSQHMFRSQTLSLALISHLSLSNDCANHSISCSFLIHTKIRAKTRKPDFLSRAFSYCKSLRLFAVADCCLSGSQTCDWNTERRAAHVVQARFEAELN